MADPNLGSKSKKKPQTNKQIRNTKTKKNPKNQSMKTKSSGLGNVSDHVPVSGKVCLA